MRKGKKKQNQAGMSLVELVVVILIIGILSVGGGIGITYINHMNATGAAEKLNSLLMSTKVLTISSDSTVELELLKEGNDYYGKVYEGGTEVDKVKLGNGALTITVESPAPTPDTVIGSGSSCTFSFNKANGAFSDSCEYTSVVIVGSKTKTVRLVNKTGRSYIE